MSEESINDESTNPELLELEASLRGLSAASNLNRAELLFEAGRRSADGRSGSRSGIWQVVSTVLALMLVGQSFLFWSSDDRQIADSDSARNHSVTPEAETPNSKTDSHNGQATDFKDVAERNNLPTQRSEFLELRRVALARGVDAAFSSRVDDSKHSAPGQSTQQELLRELLGS